MHAAARTDEPQVANHGRRRHHAPRATSLAGAAAVPDALLSLQRTAGNRAVAELLGADAPTIQRCGATPPEQCACHDGAHGGAHGPAAEDHVSVQSGSHVQRQDTGPKAGPRRERPPRLFLSDEQLRELVGPGRAAAATGAASRSGGGEAAGGEACLPAGRSEAWMPAISTRLPIQLGEGTRRRPKLKEPHGPTGPKCRGACGPDCPKTCQTIGTYEESYTTGDGCSYVIEFPDALKCGTHQGCRTHDADFDLGVSHGERGLMEPKHQSGNAAAATRYGLGNTMSWMFGGGPYDAWWYFVGTPAIKESTGSTTSGPPISYQHLTGPLFDPASPMSPQERQREFRRLEHERDPGRPSWEIILPVLEWRF